MTLDKIEKQMDDLFKTIEAYGEEQKRVGREEAAKATLATISAALGVSTKPPKQKRRTAEEMAAARSAGKK